MRSAVRTRLLVGIGILLGVTLPAWGQADGDSTAVRIRLHHGSAVPTATVTPDGHPMEVRVPGGGAPALRVRPGDTLTMGVRQKDVYARQGDAGVYATSLRLASQVDDATWSLAVGDASPRRYTGTLHLAPDSGTTHLALINHVPLENYVASVVAREYGLDDRAGARAMAVVARTYGLYASQKFDGAFDHADGTLSQVYEGAGAATDRSRRATEATRGQVLTHDGRLVQAVYHSSSGGHTADNEDVWKADKALPYLRGRSDPYDQQSPHHTWQARVDRPSVLRALTRRQNASVEGFTIGERVRHGRVETINVLRSDGSEPTMNANAFRLLVNRAVEGDPLKSTWFDARRDGDAYVFEGRGFGHGVGLSQWGAHAMAQQGKSYREILTFYYNGVEVERHDGAEIAPPAEPVAQTPAVEEAPPDSTTGRIGW